MKTNKHHIFLWVALLFMTGLAASCVKDDYAAAGDTATVNLYFNTRNGEPGDASDAGTAPLDDNEGIKTLRVIITDESGTIEKNVYSGGYDNEERLSLTIMDVPVGTKNFYVIANEASVGLAPEELEALKTVDDAFLNRLVSNEAEAYFPRMRNQINELGLPITGIKESVELAKGKTEEVTIPITHAVAKIVLDIDNLMTESFRVDEVLLGRFIADQTRLFPGRGADAGTLRTHSFTATTAGIEVGPGKHPAAFVCYVYETGRSAPYTDFTLGLGSPSVPEIRDSKPFFDSTRNWLDRNEQLVISATVNVHGEVTLSLAYDVKPWTAVEVGVPPFN